MQRKEKKKTLLSIRLWSRLYTHRTNVDKENQDRLKRLPSPTVVYQSQDTGSKQAKAWLDKNCIASARLELKLGAQVMLLKNLVWYKRSNGYGCCCCCCCGSDIQILF